MPEDLSPINIDEMKSLIMETLEETKDLSIQEDSMMDYEILDISKNNEAGKLLMIGGHAAFMIDITEVSLEDASKWLQSATS